MGGLYFKRALSGHGYVSNIVQRCKH